MARAFTDLDEREILALAMSQEEEDAKIYGDFAERMKDSYPETVEMLRTMQAEEVGHAQSLRDMCIKEFGPHIPYIKRENIKGYLKRKPVWLNKILTLQQVRHEIEIMELNAMRFYRSAAKRATNPAVRDLLEQLAIAEQAHENLAIDLTMGEKATQGWKAEDETQRRTFVLQIIQPGLAGLMDGSVSTLAPVFAAAFATHNTGDAFAVGLAASLGAGISMGFAEALSDDGVLSGRGRGTIRGTVCGLMTALGGVGHTLPFLIPDFHLATGIAIGVVIVELAVISWIRHRYMETPWLAAAVQVMCGGILVFLTGILIGIWIGGAAGL